MNRLLTHLHWMITIAALSLAGLIACGGSSNDDDDDSAGDHAGVDSAFEPEERLDFDNVQEFTEGGEIELRSSNLPNKLSAPYEGGTPQIDLPPPPKSGFRLSLPRIVLEPGEEINYCQAWAIPDIEHNYVYASVFRTGPGVHHANLFASGQSPDGANAYPNCRNPDEAMTRTFGQIFDNILEPENLVFPQVLFANTTQVIGEEAFTQPEGYAFSIPYGGEVLADVHLQNSSNETITIEAVYDFYTMPAELVEHESTAFMFTWWDFNIPAQSTKTLTRSCKWYGGEEAEILSLMPHMHDWATGFDVTFTDEGGDRLELYRERDLDFTESQIKTYNPPASVAGYSQLQYSCHFDNPFDHDMGFGIGENEMCFVFGYVSPPEALSAGIIFGEDYDCISLPLGDTEKMKEISILDFIDDVPPSLIQGFLDQ